MAWYGRFCDRVRRIILHDHAKDDAQGASSFTSMTQSVILGSVRKILRQGGALCSALYGRFCDRVERHARLGTEASATGWSASSFTTIEYGTGCHTRLGTEDSVIGWSVMLGLVRKILRQGGALCSALCGRFCDRVERHGRLYAEDSAMISKAQRNHRKTPATALDA